MNVPSESQLLSIFDQMEKDLPIGTVIARSVDPILAKNASHIEKKKSRKKRQNKTK